MFYALGTNEAWIDERVNLFIALAPIIRLGNTTNKGLKKVAKNRWVVEKSLKGLGMYEVGGKDFKKEYIYNREKYCSGQITGKLCDYLDQQNVDKNQFYVKESFAAYKSKFPQPASWKQVMHFGQLAASGKFDYYDYGKIENTQKYGQKKAPEIKVSQVNKVPIAMFVG